MHLEVAVVQVQLVGKVTRVILPEEVVQAMVAMAFHQASQGPLHITLEGVVVVTIGRLNNQYKALAEMAEAGMVHLEVVVCLLLLEALILEVVAVVKRDIFLAIQAEQVVRE
jgi:hypothetical protein